MLNFVAINTRLLGSIKTSVYDFLKGLEVSILKNRCQIIKIFVEFIKNVTEFIKKINLL